MAGMTFADLPTELLVEIGYQLDDQPQASHTLFKLSLANRRFHEIYVRQAYRSFVQESKASEQRSNLRYALLKAAWAGYERPLFGLIEAGAPADGFAVQSWAGYRWYDSALIDTSHHGHPELAIKLIERYNARPDYRGAGGNNTLDYAVIGDQISLVNVILGLEPKIVKLALSGHTVRHKIVDLDRTTILKLILHAIKNLDLGQEYVEKYQNKMLISASKLGRINIIDALLNETDVDPNTAFGDNRQHALNVAIDRGHPSVFTRLLSSGRIDPNLWGRDGQTPLFAAARKGDVSIVTALLGTGRVDCFLQDDFHRTPLHYAVRRRHRAVTKLILLKAAGLEVLSPGSDDPLVLHKAANGTGSFRLSLRLKSPANLSDHSSRAKLAVSAASMLLSDLRLNELLDREERLSDVKLERSKGLLYNLMELLELLLEPTDPERALETEIENMRIGTTNESKQPTLEPSCPDTECKWTITYAAKGADPPYSEVECDLASLEEEDVGIKAVIQSEVITIGRLFLGGDASQQTFNPPHHRHVAPQFDRDLRLFSWSLHRHNDGLACVLLESGRCLTGPKTSLDEQLHLAIKNERLVLVRHLVHRGANPSSQGFNTGSALMMAVERGNFAIVQTLIQLGAALDAHPCGRTQRKTALILACELKHKSIVRHLIESGANVNIQDSHGRTALMAATARDGDLDIAKLLLCRASQAPKDNEEYTALFQAIKTDNRDAITLLLNVRNSAVNIAGPRGTTPLLWALTHTIEWGLAEALIRAGADFYKADIYGNTPFAYAAHGKWYDALELMLEHGATFEAAQNGRDIATLLWFQGGRAREIYTKWYL